VVIFAVQKLGAEAEACKDETRETRVLLDPRGETAKRYNALWPARTYAFDEHGVMTYVQPETTFDPLAPLEVSRLWRGAS
jgi:hypothetical protein